MEPLRAVPSFGDEIEVQDLDDVSLPALPPDPGSPLTFLSPEQADALALEIEEMLDANESAMQERWDRERLIDDCYHLVPQKDWQGQFDDASELMSETIMAAVDQAHARVTGQLLSVQPLVAFEGIESMLPPEDSTPIAESLQTWEDRYLKNQIRVESILPQILYPTTKFGTAVVYSWWDPGKNAVDWRLIHNRDVVLWTPWETDWQKAEWAGHRSVLTVSQFRRFAMQLGLSPDDVESIVADGGETRPPEAEATFADMETEGIKPDSMSSRSKHGLVPIYELWGNVVVPGAPLPAKFRLYFHRDKKRILWAELNDQRSGRHPYHPIRYKITGNSAWGIGVGHEMLPFQAQDTMYMNLETDTLKASCFGVYLINRGSIANALFEMPTPGQVIPTEDPKGDFNHVNLANAEPLAMLQMARGTNEQRKTNASGLAAVLQGQGDPTMKSGGGTGAVMELVAQASKKFGQIDRNIRNDFASLCLHTLEVASQYSQGAAFAEHLPREDAEPLVAFMATIPAGKPLDRVMRVAIQAPSASNNEEMRRERLLVVYNMLQQHADAMIQKYATPILMATNPAAIIAYQKKWADLITAFGERVLESHEVPGVKDKIPKLDEFVAPDPAQQQINVLLQQLQQMSQQMEMMAQAQNGPPGAGNSGDDAGVGGSGSSPSPGSGGPV